MKKYDIIIIGGGPAGQFAAIETAKNKLSTVLIEKSGSFEDTLCEKLVKQTYNAALPESLCKKHFCLEGLGGAALHFESNFDNYFEDNSIFLFSSSLIETLKNKVSLAGLINEVYGKFFSYGLTLEEEKHETCSPLQLSTRFDIFSAGNIPVNLVTVRKIANAMEHDLKSSGAEVMEHCEFVDMDQYDRSYLVHLQTKNKSRITLYGSNIIFAMGKRSFGVLLPIIDKLGIDYTFPDYVELGIRVEVPREWLNDILSQNHNPKIKLNLSHDKYSRSFCFCDGGRLMQYPLSPEYKDVLILDGQHAHTVKGQKTNFAILTKVKIPDEKSSIDHVLNYVKDCSNFKGDHLPAQLYQDYLFDRKSSLQNINEIRPTLSKLTPSNFRDVFSDYGIDVITFLTSLAEDIGKEIPMETLIVAPAVEKYLPRVILDSNLKSSIGGAYFVGDCSGNVSGVISAAVTGLKAGKAIVGGGD